MVTKWPGISSKTPVSVIMKLLYNYFQQALSSILLFRYVHFLEILFKNMEYENMSPCPDSNVNVNYERIASWDGCQFRTGTLEISETSLATHCCGQRNNHSAMTIVPLTTVGTSWAISHNGQNSESNLFLDVSKLVATCHVDCFGNVSDDANKFFAW